MGLDLTTYALAVAELSRGWMSIAGILNGQFLLGGMIASHGTEEQKRALPAAPRRGRAALLLLDDGARGRLGRARDPHDGAARGRRAGDRRHEDVGHERARSGLIGLLVKTDPNADPPQAA